MKLRLYAGPRAWLVVPDCLLAPQSAIDTHGPLRLVGEIDDGALKGMDIATLTAEFDARSFAEIPEHTAQRLVQVLDVPVGRWGPRRTASG